METIKTEDSNVENTTMPGSENAQTEAAKDYVPLEHVNSANRQEATKQFIVEQAEKSTVENQNLVNLVKANREVEITDEDKSAFLESVINGSRIYAHVNLFGGKVRVKFRSRRKIIGISDPALFTSDHHLSLLLSFFPLLLATDG